MQLHSQLRDALAGEVALQIEKLREPALFSPIEGKPLEDEELGTSLHDAMIVPAIVGDDDESPDRPGVAALAARHSVSPWNRFRRVLSHPAWIAAAAVLLVSLGALFFLTRQSAPTLAAAINATWESAQVRPSRQGNAIL